MENKPNKEPKELKDTTEPKEEPKDTKQNGKGDRNRSATNKYWESTYWEELEKRKKKSKKSKKSKKKPTKPTKPTKPKFIDAMGKYDSLYSQDRDA